MKIGIELRKSHGQTQQSYANVWIGAANKHEPNHGAHRNSEAQRVEYFSHYRF